MKIKDVEQKTGMNRSQIRFYEKAGLLAPKREKENRYRDYTEADVEELKKILLLRGLGISVEEIRRIQSGEKELLTAVEMQRRELLAQSAAAEEAARLCGLILKDGRLSYFSLQPEVYLTSPFLKVRLERVFLQDRSIAWRWLCGMQGWLIFTILCLLAAAASYSFLPERIPIQFKGSEPVSFAGREAVFFFPLFCLVFRFILRPVIADRIRRSGYLGDAAEAAGAVSSCGAILTFFIFLFVIAASLG